MSYKDRVAIAVNNDAWQKFRISLKGKTTEQKLARLKTYWWLSQDMEHFPCRFLSIESPDECVVCLRVDNYIKALCRGGQLFPGESLQSALKQSWDLKIKS